MFSPAAIYLEQYRKCRKEQAQLRESLALPKNEQEEHRFCKKYYKLYVAKLVSDLI